MPTIHVLKNQLNECKTNCELTTHKFYITVILCYHDDILLSDNNQLCCKLEKVCLKEPEMVPFRDIEIDRNSLKILEPRIGHGSFGEVFKGMHSIHFHPTALARI